MLSACSNSESENYISKHTSDTMMNHDVVIVDRDEEVVMEEKTAERELIMENSDDNTDNVFIDCQTIDECTNKVMILKEKFDNIIKNISYIDIKDKFDNHIGYYFDYEFNDYQFDNIVDCMDTGELLTNYLNGHNISFACDEDGLLKAGEAK